MPDQWKPDGNDAAVLAAFRILINRLEAEAVSTYLTDRSKHAQILEALQQADTALRSIRGYGIPCVDTSDCPPGYVCVGGRCEPDYAALAKREKA